MVDARQPSERTGVERVPAPAWWYGWAGVWVLTLGLAAARVAYNLWLSPYELAADEAHYWDWSRHLAMSYYTKGPGVAWVIRGATELFGNAEWAVRMPTIVASAIATVVLARLGQRCAGGDRRAAFLSAAAFCVVPAFLATSMLMTIDMAYIACWSLAALAAWELCRAQDEGSGGYGWAAGLGLAIGVGFLFKYTILLLLPGVFAYRMVRGSHVSRSRGLLASAICGVVVVACLQPVLLWNEWNGWPTIAHLLGHLGLPGGDVPRHEGGERAWTVMWLVNFVGAEIGIVGPMLVLMVGAGWRALRHPVRSAGAEVFLAACAAPIVVVYLGVSLMTDAEANWPIAGYATLCVLVGVRGVGEMARHREMVRAWRALTPPRPRRGMLRRQPETGWQIAWHWSIGYGVVAGIGMLMLPLLEHVPVVADLVPTHRLTGYEARAARLADSLREVHGARTGDALVVANRYNDASRMAYYLFRTMGGDEPVVACGGAYLGERRSAYDYWAETDVTDPRWLGQTVHLVGGGEAKWERGFVFERIEEPAGEAFMIGFGYGGVREGDR